MKIAIVALLTVLLTGCSSLLYRVPVIQGNVLSNENVSKLKLGMTKPEVRYLLGTPLVNSDFGKHRWDYVFYLRDTRGRTIQSRLTVFFQRGKVARIAGDESYEALLPENQEKIGEDDVEAAESESILPDDNDSDLRS